MVEEAEEGKTLLSSRVRTAPGLTNAVGLGGAQCLGSVVTLRALGEPRGPAILTVNDSDEQRGVEE